MASSGLEPVVVDVLWIPLGAGQRVVRTSGWIYEAIVATAQRRPRCALYHSALVVHLPEADVVVEVAPVPDDKGTVRGVAGEGAVGVGWLGRFRLFRYEVRCWANGEIPDAQFATVIHRIDIPPATALRLLDLTATVPRPVWGRDEAGVGDMWNSNSVTSWLLTVAGIDVGELGPPPGGRGPGWDAGIRVAAGWPGDRLT